MTVLVLASENAYSSNWMTMGNGDSSVGRLPTSDRLWRLREL